MYLPHRDRWTKTALAWLCCIAVIAVLACSGGNDAQAQNTVRVETFSVVVDSLLMTLESPPTVEVDGEATTYTIASDGNLIFTPQGLAERALDLDPGDIVIERPAANTLTVIREI